MPESSRSIDDLSRHLGFHWEAPDRLRLTVLPKHINPAGLLSGAVVFAMVDYCMGSTLWVERNEGEAVATINISINYAQTAREGDVICTCTLDRRNDRVAVLRSEVHHEDGRLLATAVGSYSIFPAERLKR